MFHWTYHSDSPTSIFAGYPCYFFNTYKWRCNATAMKYSVKSCLCKCDHKLIIRIHNYKAFQHIVTIVIWYKKLDVKFLTRWFIRDDYLVENLARNIPILWILYNKMTINKRRTAYSALFRRKGLVLFTYNRMNTNIDSR